MSSTAAPFNLVGDLLGPGLQQIAGASIAGEVPIAQALVNRAIAGHLAAADLPVSAVQVELHEADVLTAHVTLRASFVPTLRVVARIDQQPALPGAAVLGLRWSMPGLGLLARMAAPVLARVGRLPPGLLLDGDRLLVDLGQLLESQGAGDLVRHVTALRITTREGAVVVRFEFRVPEIQPRT